MRRIAAMLLLALTALPAFAEPIATYTVTGSGTRNLLVLEGTRYDPASGTDLPAIFTGSNPAPDSPRTGELTERFGTGFGSSLDSSNPGIGLAYLGSGSSGFASGSASSYDRAGKVEFAVTDTASGMSNKVEFAVRAASAVSAIDGDLSFQTYVLLDADLPSSTSWTLGDNRYDIAFKIYNQESGETIIADYTITALSATVATPEPATVVLAALGLGGVLARRRFRSA